MTDYIDVLRQLPPAPPADLSDTPIAATVVPLPPTPRGTLPADEHEGDE